MTWFHYTLIGLYVVWAIPFAWIACGNARYPAKHYPKTSEDE